MTYKALFISDLHLGTKNSNSQGVLDLLRDCECEYLYLVGDIIDGWALKREWKWPQEHSDVVQKILRKARKGTKVYYILGNHDEFIRTFLPIVFGKNLHILNESIYNGSDGKKYLVTHGDFFDSITMTKRWLAVAGDIGYAALLNFNRPLNKIRKKLGYKKYWSLSKFIKENVKKSIVFITDFEKILSCEAKNRGLDGVICGHIHKAQIKKIDDIDYLNCGDWVESNTALAQKEDGSWELLER